ncbi:unnamed protein product [Prorocentrum cordatum]|uniref:Uncharacterized protein n=1 Tax=Prorocentrum cordatum TaxID=2364126 RepID=A0ABN9Y165_9DINO|nr:unnamed protein product [Polarella glacialis]
MRADGTQAIAGVENVPLVPPRMQRLAAAVREMAVASGFKVYDRRQGAKVGLWRMVMVRMNPKGEMLVMVLGPWRERSASAWRQSCASTCSTPILASCPSTCSSTTRSPTPRGRAPP